MKSIFFYANFRTWDYTLGITRKVFCEIEAFKQLGYQVTYTGYLEDGVGIFDNEGNIVLFKKYPVGNKTIQHVIRRRMILKLAVKYLRNTGVSYEFGYSRYHFFDNTYLDFLKELKKHVDISVIEAHSTPKFTSKFSYMYIIGKQDKYWSKNANKYVDAIASMSNEDRLWGIDTFKISNAIDLDSIRLHNYNGDNRDINFISVSYERDVHGYDRLIRGISEYYKTGGNRNVYFHMVGSSMASTVKLIKELHLEERCFTYGPKCGSELDDIYDKSNIGVGCLANHRIGSFFGSALKTKEYIAKGIPFIYGWQEKVLENFEYAKKYELCEDPIDVSSVIEFYDSLNKTDLASIIRSKLGEEDSWLYQMRIVVDNVTKLLNK